MGRKNTILKRAIVLLTCLLSFLISLVQAQVSRFIWPIDSPFVMTANYGELRPNHFHTGIDFTTHGEIKRPVYSIQEGYVSRIRVSPTGYGNCVYITHPGGKVSVYAHLSNFSLKIDKVVREYRSATQSNDVDFMPKARTVYVRQNEIIGLSGNTGGSTGPHLHFEIRDELTEVPLNPLLFYKINDHTFPQVDHLAIYDLADTLSPKLLKVLKVKADGKDSLHLEQDHLSLDRAVVGFAFSGHDRFTASGSPNNIFSVSLNVDGLPFYAHQLNQIPFSDLRYINEYTDELGHKKLQKCFMPSIYPAGFYQYSFTKGRLLLDSAFRKVEMVFADESGNTRRLAFFVRSRNFNYYEAGSFKTDVFVNCSRDTVLLKNDLQVQISAGSFFNSSYLEVENKLSQGKLSVLPALNLRQPIKIGFKLSEKESRVAGKMVLVGNTGTNVATVIKDSVYFSTKVLGQFKRLFDTVPPKIKLKHTTKQLANAWKMDALSFTITDELSGIGTYHLWLNNVWVQCDYDAKSDELTYYFDEDTPMGLLNFKLEVADKAGNKRELDFVLKK